jgi:hypothetical protein
LKLGAESREEANEWCEAILAASEDGGPPPKVEKEKVRKCTKHFSVGIPEH